MLTRVDAARLEAVEIDLLHFIRRRLENHLELKVLEQAVGILAEAAVGRAPRRLHVCHVPGLGSQHLEEGGRIHGARADFKIVRLLQHTPALRPKSLQAQDKLLESGRDRFA